MNAVYVQMPKEDILASRDTFETNVTKFLADYERHRLLKLITPPREIRVLGFSFRRPGIDEKKAFEIFMNDRGERDLLNSIVLGISRLRELFVLADQAPRNSKIMVQLEDMRWFSNDHYSGRGSQCKNRGDHRDRQDEGCQYRN